MPGDLEDECSELVLYAARLLRAVQRRVGHSAGLRVLSQLDELGPLGVTDLAKADRTSQPTMSGAVRQLEEQGWVARSADSNDARRTVVEITEAGRAQLAEARKLNGVIVAERFRRTDHTSDDVVAATAVLRDLLARL